MSIVESEGLPSWSLDGRETGENTKCLWVGVMGLKAWGEGAEKIGSLFFSSAVPSTTPTHGHFVLSPVSLASRDQDGGPSHSTIDIYDQTEKLGTVNSLVAPWKFDVLKTSIFVLEASLLGQIFVLRTSNFRRPTISR